MKKIFIKKHISDRPTLIFSRYETGTTGIFLRLTLTCHQQKIRLGLFYKLFDTSSSAS